MKVSELLTDASRWTKGTEARDEFGVPVHERDERAVRWCLLGALSRCRLESNHLVYRLYEMGTTVEEWNDDPSRTFAEVRALIETLDL